jgi:hypothetical protein
MNRATLMVSTLALCNVVSGCGGTRITSQPSQGTITVGVSSTGPALAGLTFDLEVGGERQRIKADGGVATVAGLDPGAHDVTLSLPARCRSEGSASRRVTVSARRTTAIRFVVSCR